MAHERAITLRVTAVVLVAAGIAIGVVVAVGNRRYYGPIESILVVAAWTALLGAPAALIVLGLRGRPVLLLPAGVILLPLAFLSFAGVLLPLLVPAVFAIAAYGRRAQTVPRPVVPAAVTSVLVVVLLMAAAMTLFVHADPRSYDLGNEAGGTSDVLTGIEALVMIGLSTLAVWSGWRLAAPRQRPLAASRQ